MENEEHSIGYLLNLTSSYFKLAGKSLIKERDFDGITPEQFGVLYTLYKENGIYQRQISQILMKDRPNVTRILGILEKKDFLKREKDDENKRISKVFITQKGKDVVQRIVPYTIKLLNKATKNLSETEIQGLCNTLEKIRNNLSDSFNIQI